jgi:glycosyltransferase involved in cell wall biosynthesis
VGGTPEVIQDGVSGFLVPPGDPVALASAICEAVADEEQLREFAFQARQCVLESYSFHSQVDHYLDLFARLCPAPVRDEPLAAEPTCER